MDWTEEKKYLETDYGSRSCCNLNLRGSASLKCLATAAALPI